MALLTPARLRQIAFGVATALVGVGLLVVAYTVLGPEANALTTAGQDGAGLWALLAGFTGLFGLTAILLSVFLFFVPAVISGK